MTVGPSYSEIAGALAGSGLLVRGGFAADTGERLPPGPSGAPARALVLVGNAGRELWPAFERGRLRKAHPLDAWTRRIVEPVAARAPATAVYPNDRPWPPFQQWAMRAEPVAPSPIGLLVHPTYGLWHAYRAALLLDDVPDDLPPRESLPSPCDGCAGRPCLSACPVGAHSPSGFDLDACAGHLRRSSAPRCVELGCRSRDACPVGGAYRFPDEQVAFHMRAFARSRAR
jgi:hypothetical protein